MPITKKLVLLHQGDCIFFENGYSRKIIMSCFERGIQNVS